MSRGEKYILKGSIARLKDIIAGLEEVYRREYIRLGSF